MLSIACFLTLLAVQPTWAADFEVDSFLDGVDSDLSDGECLNVTVVAGGACTLRAAIQQANFDITPDTIILRAGTYTLTLENPSDNAEDAAATGDLDITSNLIINGVAADTTIIAAGADLHDRIFHLIDELAVVELNRLTVRNGDTSELNGETDGGGILNAGGKLNAFEVAVSDNRTPTFGGGVMTVGTETTFFHRCTINGNSAVGGNARGGGLWLGQNHTLTLANCTVSGNEAESRGGGLDISNNSEFASLINTTVANNRLLDDPEEGAGIYIGNSTEVVVISSIFADNFAQGNVANDCYGQFDLLDHSLVEVRAPGNDCIIAGDGENISSTFGSAIDPLLEPLADNGGDLLTHALRRGSIAIDTGSPLPAGSGGSACYATDERGVSRPNGAFCDMGAYEAPAYLFMPELAKTE